jgi:cell division protein FtsX
MRESKTSIKNKDVKNWISPNCSLTQKEFLNDIQKTENGKFHSVQQSMKNFELWLNSKTKKLDSLNNSI